MGVRHLVEGHEERVAQLLERPGDQVRGIGILVSAHLDGNALVDSTVSRDVQVATGDLVHGGTHGTREAHNLLHAIILHIVEDEDALNRDRGTGGLRRSRHPGRGG